MIRLYGSDTLFIITGWFYNEQDGHNSGNFPFGGHFNLDSEKRLEGRLSDDGGASRINGTMTRGVLEFEKTYEPKGIHKKRTYYYKFEKKSGIWVGGWFTRKIETTYLDNNPSLQARCQTLRAWDAYRAMNKLRLDKR